MSGRRDPWEIPEWHAIGREAALVRHLIGSGATALGRANYADKIGEYYTAFFGLSVGLERLAKLILVADHAIKTKGAMPKPAAIRRYGHKLIELLDKSEATATQHKLKLSYSRPATIVAIKITECLDAFADANRGRYANFAALGDPNLKSNEPIRKWWGDVAELILKEHYYGTIAQGRVEGSAKVIDKLISPFTMVIHTNEAGDTMRDVYSASVRTGQTNLVQRYGRYYALTIVRWLANVFSELSSIASDKYGADAFYGVYELFQTYTVGDEFLKTRKIWPLH